MIRVKTTRFITSKKDLNRLFQYNRTSAQVWNDCLDHARAHHKQNGKWINKSQLQKHTKKQYQLHSQSIQAVCHKYLWARENTKKARDQGHTNIRYPWRKKKNYNTKWAKDGFTIEPNGRIELSLGIWQGKRQAPIVVFVKSLPAGCVKELELIYDRGLKLAISYDDGLAPKKNNSTNAAAIDLGEIHSIAAVSNAGAGIIITGRKLRSLKRLRNKKQQELQRLIACYKKGSRQWKKYRRALNYILSKSDAQLRDALHKTTRQFVRWCLENNIQSVVVGDVEGVQRHTSKRNKRNKDRKQIRSRKHNQRMSQWQFGKLHDYLKYKLEAEDISIKKVSESYTSQTCPVCGRRKKVTGRVYMCHCGYKEHRDIHGAKNILTKHLYLEMRQIEVGEIKYLRIA